MAFPPGHRFGNHNGIPITDIAGESYLSRVNCEYRDHLRTLCHERGFEVKYAYRSEREDWIQIMVAAGMGVCFMPEYSITVPGVVARP